MIQKEAKRKNKKSKLHKDKAETTKKDRDKDDEKGDEDFHKNVKKSKSDYYRKNNSTVKDPEKSKSDGDFEPTTVKVEYNEVEVDDDEEGNDKKGKKEHEEKDDKMIKLNPIYNIKIILNKKRKRLSLKMLTVSQLVS